MHLRDAKVSLIKGPAYRAQRMGLRSNRYMLLLCVHSPEAFLCSRPLPAVFTRGGGSCGKSCAAADSVSSPPPLGTLAACCGVSVLA